MTTVISQHGSTQQTWPAAANRQAVDKPMPDESYTVTVSRDQPATVAPEGLTVQLTQVQDSRCPVGTQCLWAGHAAVTLKVTQAGFPAQSVVVGTEAAPDMKLPYQAVFRAYTLSLSALEPQPTAQGQAPVSRYVATLRIAKTPVAGPK